MKIEQYANIGLWAILTVEAELMVEKYPSDEYYQAQYIRRLKALRKMVLEETGRTEQELVDGLIESLKKSNGRED